MLPAQDFKRIFDGDEGPNTGGMGAYTPLPWAPADLVAEVQRDVLQPTDRRDGARGTPFRGLLYAGLALTSRGLRVWSSTPASATRRPSRCWPSSTRRSRRCSCCGDWQARRRAAPGVEAGRAVAVVMASEGYPESSWSGDLILGIETLGCEGDVDVLHAGTARDATADSSPPVAGCSR